MAQHLVIMGVAGSGKTTVAQILAGRLGWPQAEADDFHPAANIARMAAGNALRDEDRWPWLGAIRDWIGDHDDAGTSSIVTCSALKRVYRDVLRQAPGRIRFVHLEGPPDLIAGRMGERAGHFMPTTLLPSQFDTLEPLAPDEDGVRVPVAASPQSVADDVLRRLGPLTGPNADPASNSAPNAAPNSARN